MFKKFSKLISMLMALILFVLCFAGCGEDKESSGNTSSGNSGGTESEIEFLVNPEDYRGTEITYVTWKDPAKNEDGPVVAAFEKEYGIKVNIQLVEQWGYVNSIAASIASGKQGDVFFENGDFPGSLTVMQPLDAAKINFDDPIWRQSVIKNSTIDGHPYLVDTVSNVWSEVDLCVYNKKLFADNNITTPEEYYEAGKWTFDAFRKCAMEIAAIGNGYVGASAIGDVALAAAGSSFYKYEDGIMKLSVDDHLYEVMTFLAQMHDDGLLKVNTESNSSLETGKTGMALTNCFALKKTGYYTNINPDHLGVTYLPKWKETDETPFTGLYRGWGLIKGAKNPEAAGIFLRYYLDVNNYDLESTFHSPDLANFFFKVTGDSSKEMFQYFTPNMVKATGMGEEYQVKWQWYSASQIKSELQSDLNVMNNMVTKANELIAKEKKWLADTYQ